MNPPIAGFDYGCGNGYRTASPLRQAEARLAYWYDLQGRCQHEPQRFSEDMSGEHQRAAADGIAEARTAIQSLRPVRVFTLPDGRKVPIAEYVRSWRVLKTVPPEMRVLYWGHFPEDADAVLKAIRDGVHDRINRHLPWFNRGRKWAQDWQVETSRASRQLNRPRLIIDWLPAWLLPRFQHRLRNNEQA
jgi:hypothetical protein